MAINKFSPDTKDMMLHCEGVPLASLSDEEILIRVRARRNAYVLSLNKTAATKAEKKLLTGSGSSSSDAPRKKRQASPAKKADNLNKALSLLNSLLDKKS